MSTREKLGVWVLGLLLAGLLTLGWLHDGVWAAERHRDDQLESLLKVFTEALATVEDNYAKEIESRELIESAVNGMLATLDPHSSFFSAPDYGRMQEEQQGQYFGLGISIRPERPGSGRVRIVQPPDEGTPAAKVGLRYGDVIAKVRGEAIDDWDVNDVISTLKGPKGTSVNITVERPGEPEPITVDVVRDAIPIYSIRYAFEIRPGIGYIRIDRFAETTAEELGHALIELGESTLKGLILDLRNNPGGALSQAISVSDQFLEKGQVIVTTRGRDERNYREFKAPRGRRALYPMVVLINEHSASASEIVSGALQDHDRAIILGETSFGKALVQTVYPVRDGRGLALTTGKYYTPSNRLIQRPYSEGFYDYLARNGGGGNSDAVFTTDAGRKVFGGGGIAPDVNEKGGRFARLVPRLSRRNVIERFAARLTRGEFPGEKRFHHEYQEIKSWPEDRKRELKENLKISKDGATLRRLLDFAREEGVSFTSDELEDARAQLANQLEREAVLTLLGESEAMKVHLRIDNQVQRALEVMPQAAQLLK